MFLGLDVLGFLVVHCLGGFSFIVLISQLTGDTLPTPGSGFPLCISLAGVLPQGRWSQCCWHCPMYS